MKAELVLGEQRMVCSVRLSSQKENTYEGLLSAPLSDPGAAEFWRAYDRAVNDVSLLAVDELERRLARLPFFVVVGENRFHAAAVDLQIYPSSRQVSFSLTQE